MTENDSINGDGYDYDDKEIGNGLSATVKLFHHQSGECMTTMKSDLNKTIKEMKQELAVQLNISVESIVCEFQGGKLADSTFLKDIEDMASNDELKFALIITQENEATTSPCGTSQASGQTGSGTKRGDPSITVVRHPSASVKKYLGGYRNIKNGVIYHHASIQTLPKKWSPDEIAAAANKRCRDTQTSQKANVKLQTANNTSTQMTKPGCYVSQAFDKLITPRPYETADEFFERKVRHVVVLQKYLRRWLAKRYVRKLREIRSKRQEWEREEEGKDKRKREDEVRKERERRTHPRSKQDFDHLFSSLKKWKQDEEEEINKRLSGAERKAALCMLLDREAELIAMLGRLQKEADEMNKERSIVKYLDETSAPKTWKRSSDGKDVSMETPEMMRADQLRQLYKTLKMKFEMVEERLDALLVLKNTIQDYDCRTTREILNLIERETTLLMRGVSEEHLEGLRMRINTLFVQLTKDPKFNPQAAKFVKTPSFLQQQFKKLLSSDDLIDRKSTTAKESNLLNNFHSAPPAHSSSSHIEEFSLYESLLEDVVKNGVKHDNNTSIALLLQVEDMKYLYENIWEGQSALSLNNKTSDLCFAAWVKDECWSPWNCVLLTRKEAAAHKKIDNISKVYGADLMQKITGKHSMAQAHFTRLQLLADSLHRHQAVFFDRSTSKILA